MSKDPEQLRFFLTGLVVALVLVSTAATVASHVGPGDEFCAHALGEGATYVDDQPFFNRELDCRYPNGTVARDVDVPPMNLTGQTESSYPSWYSARPANVSASHSSSRS